MSVCVACYGWVVVDHVLSSFLGVNSWAFEFSYICSSYWRHRMTVLSPRLSIHELTKLLKRHNHLLKCCLLRIICLSISFLILPPYAGSVSARNELDFVFYRPATGLTKSQKSDWKAMNITKNSPYIVIYGTPNRVPQRIIWNLPDVKNFLEVELPITLQDQK